MLVRLALLGVMPALLGAGCGGTRPAEPEVVVPAHAPPGAVWGGTVFLGTALGLLKALVYGGPSPLLVVVLHGDSPRGPPSYQYRFAAKVATSRADITVAAVLRPGYGDGTGEESAGRRGSATADNYTPEVIDALAEAIGELRRALGSARVLLVGHSGGAAIAADLLARHPGVARGALLVACPCDVPAFRQHMKSVAPGGPWLWDEPVRSLSPHELVGQIPAGTVISMLAGADDDVTPPDLSRQFAAAAQARGLAVRLAVLPGKGHDILLDEATHAALGALLDEVRAQP